MFDTDLYVCNNRANQTHSFNFCEKMFMRSLPKVLFKNILYNDVQLIRNISLFVLLYECTKKDKNECTSNERTRRKRKFCFLSGGVPTTTT